MNVLVRVSPSQIKTFRACPRKWAFSYIDNVPRKTSVAAQIGTDIHKELEGWLKHGTLPGPIARKNILTGWLPTPGPDLLVEVPFDHPIPEAGDDTIMRGVIDFVDPRGPRPVLGDHKTTGDLKYALTEETLPVDEQAVIYGRMVADVFKAPVIDARWLYYEYSKTTMLPTGSRKVEVVLTKPHLDAQWADIVGTVQQIRHHKLNTHRALDVEPNALACQALGGCEFRSICPVTAEQALAAHWAQFAKFEPKKELQTVENNSTLLADSAIRGVESIEALQPTGGRMGLDFSGLSKNMASKTVGNGIAAQPTPLTQVGPR